MIQNENIDTSIDERPINRSNMTESTDQHETAPWTTATTFKTPNTPGGENK